MRYLGLLLLLLSPSLFAKRFANQYMEFELPAGWDCALEGAEYVCQSDNAARKKEAIVIMAAKVRGEEDSLESYQAYLKKTKTYTLPGGKTQVSEPKAVVIKEVNGQRWIDALHMASEIPGFYTRYLATTKEDLGVAVTFSVAKDFYESYQPVFDQMVNTLRVFRQAQVAGNFKMKDQKENLLGESTAYVPEELQDISTQRQKNTAKGSSSSSSMIILGLLAVVGFIIWKKKRKK